MNMLLLLLPVTHHTFSQVSAAAVSEFPSSGLSLSLSLVEVR